MCKNPKVEESWFKQFEPEAAKSLLNTNGTLTDSFKWKISATRS